MRCTYLSEVSLLFLFNYILACKFLWPGKIIGTKQQREDNVIRSMKAGMCGEIYIDTFYRVLSQKQV